LDELRGSGHDLLHLDKSLIHVKRLRNGAASITHLFLQGRFYGDAFLSDPRCRKGMRDCIVGNIGGRNPDPFTAVIPELRDELIANEYKIVFCMLSERAEVDVSSLPFMARYELMYTHRHLHGALGFKCEVAFRLVQLGP
jgi:uncharacterized protein (TIGR04141 family)